MQWGNNQGSVWNSVQIDCVRRGFVPCSHLTQQQTNWTLPCTCNLAVTLVDIIYGRSPVRPVDTILKRGSRDNASWNTRKSRKGFAMQQIGLISRYAWVNCVAESLRIWMQVQCGWGSIKGGNQSKLERRVRGGEKMYGQNAQIELINFHFSHQPQDCNFRTIL